MDRRFEKNLHGREIGAARRAPSSGASHQGGDAFKVRTLVRGAVRAIFVHYGFRLLQGCNQQMRSLFIFRAIVFLTHFYFAARLSGTENHGERHASLD